MSPSDRPGRREAGPLNIEPAREAGSLNTALPPEVLAIAVALAVLWPGADAAAVTDRQGAATSEPSPWRWGGRRWERPAGYRWS